MLAGKIFLIAILILLFAAIFHAARRQKTHPRMRVSRKFIAAFINDVQDLSQGKGDAYELVKEAFPKQEKAYLQIRSRMSGRSRKCFDETGKDYSCFGNRNPTPFPEQYFAGGNEVFAKGIRLFALQRIKRIRSFAEIR